MVEGAALGRAELYGSLHVRPTVPVTIEWRLERPRVARRRWRTEGLLSLVGGRGLPRGVPSAELGVPGAGGTS